MRRERERERERCWRERVNRERCFNINIIYCHCPPIADTTGEYSVYTEYEQAEIMFHVSTFLPFTENNKQQVISNNV